MSAAAADSSTDVGMVLVVLAGTIAFMRIHTLRERLRALGANPRHEQRVLRLWSLALSQTSGRRQVEHFLPAALVSELPAIADELAALARLESQHPGEDGSVVTETDPATAKEAVSQALFRNPTATLVVAGILIGGGAVALAYSTGPQARSRQQQKNPRRKTGVFLFSSRQDPRQDAGREPGAAEPAGRDRRQRHQCKRRRARSRRHLCRASGHRPVDVRTRARCR